MTTDTEPMTDERLAEIEARASAATEGPWVVDLGEWQAPGWPSDMVYLRVVHGEPNPRSGILDPLFGSAKVSVRNDQLYRLNRANVEFASHAREDVPALLAEIDRLRAELAARPEPLGYVAVERGFSTDLATDQHAETVDRAWRFVTPEYRDQFQVCALIPVEAT